ncbi:MAG: porin family protein [Pseudomonadota bacterium]
MKKFLPSLLAATAIIAAPTAMAEGFYADGGYTYIGIDDDTVDADLGGLTARGGYDFTQNFGAELEGSFGVEDDDVLGATVELNYLVGAYGKAQLPVTEKINLFARAGVVNAELEVSDAGVSVSESDTGAGYGLGGTFNVSEQFYVRGDYTRYDIEDLEADAFTISLGLKF